MSDSEQTEQPIEVVQNSPGLPLKKTYKERLVENPLVGLG